LICAVLTAVAVRLSEHSVRESILVQDVAAADEQPIAVVSREHAARRQHPADFVQDRGTGVKEEGRGVGHDCDEVSSAVEEGRSSDETRIVEAKDSAIVRAAHDEHRVEGVCFYDHERGGGVEGDAVGRLSARDRSRRGERMQEGVGRGVVQKYYAVGLAKGYQFFVGRNVHESFVGRQGDRGRVYSDVFNQYIAIVFVVA
jgi:hypothetical protein